MRPVVLSFVLIGPVRSYTFLIIAWNKDAFRMAGRGYGNLLACGFEGINCGRDTEFAQS